MAAADALHCSPSLNSTASRSILSGSLVIQNLSPDIGLSPGFNAWMTFFGQFFDHGLDLVTKGGNGTVYIPLHDDDPLIAGADGCLWHRGRLARALRFMALTRATDARRQRRAADTRTRRRRSSTRTRPIPLIRRTRCSCANTCDVGAETLSPPATCSTAAPQRIVRRRARQLGRGQGPGAADARHQADRLRRPQCAGAGDRPVRQFHLAGPNGYAQMVMLPRPDRNDLVQEGTAAGIIHRRRPSGTSHAFLNDIAHHAAPGFADFRSRRRSPADVLQVADADTGVTDDHNLTHLRRRNAQRPLHDRRWPW